MASRFVLPFADVGSGITPEDGAKLFFFAAGTNDPKDTFSGEALITANSNPVIADANGVFDDIWMPDAARYKVQLKDKNDVQQGKVADPVISGVSPTLTAKTFDVVADMVASLELNIGDIVETAGYLSKGDGGQNQYEIVAAATGTDDGGLFIDLDTLQAKGLFPGAVRNVKQFGAKGDSVADDTTAIQAALDAVPADGGQVVFPNATRYLVSATLDITKGGTTIIGNGIGTQTIQVVNHNFNIFDVQAGSCNIKNLSVIALAQASGEFYVVDETGGTGSLTVNNFKFTGVHSAFRLTKAKSSITNGRISGLFPSQGYAFRYTSAAEARSITNVYCENGAGLDAASGIRIDDGGVSAHNCQFVKMGNCLNIAPGNGAFASSIDMVDCWFDTSSQSGVFINPTGTGIAHRIRLINCWSSSNFRGVRVEGDCGGLQIIGGHYHDNNQEAVLVGASLTVTDLLIMGISASGNATAIKIGANTGNFRILGNDLSPSNGFSANVNGINVGTGTSDNYVIANNILSGVSGTPFFNGATGTNVMVRGNIGNSHSTSAITVSASPFTHTAGASPETVYINAGTVSLIKVGGVAVLQQTNKTVTLEPFTAVEVTYSSLPSMVKTIHG